AARSRVQQRLDRKVPRPRTARRQGHLQQGRVPGTPHPEQGYRACLGLMRLGDRYGKDRLESACRRAIHIRGISYRSVSSILQNGLDRMPLEMQNALALPQAHENLRGADYYALTSDSGEL